MVSEVAPKSIKLSAFLIGTQLDIKAIKSTHNRKALEDSSTELLYLYEEGQYEYIFNYGVVVYSGFSEAKIKKKISELSSATREPHAHVLRDEHLVVIDATERQSKIEFDKVTVNRIDDKVMRIAMLNLAQSVALDK